ncbi:GNAT family N-acetyltransferase [Halorussus caseinilyticus]|uniref:GNAT family N-acetyltransferase n=1 Tax=Halorussus caseinilyticus TaxID=3034025 RepID=A0ABD5WFJ5_9EURY|nr:GNAT family N-acetyltransferase [Halorussus sp. DT72]
MTGPGGIVAAPYDFQTHDEEIDRTVSFRRAEMDDLGMLHAWLNEDHVLPYWQLDDPLPEFRDALAEKLADDHMTPYVGHLDHVPMSYWECYWAADDPIADYYDADPTDQGIHLLIGPPEYLGQGYAEPLLRAVTEMQFRHGETDRIVTEPDVRNEIVHHVFEQCGFEPQREIETDEKTALLMVCERERFEREVME